ncbi:glycoside hydrolase [Mycobacterium sp. M1]|uniref:Glycoside hydrolase n=1 Tax=Mycolicibacter acidiphilus TaxID=2835306 RepID=A0ABS5REL4_9MYCO|nr:glycoside hydrolase [Mycolicibacter acidiphilus]MBS9532634.1 glycoside hydrolase [Mycolicibacter acidiphilus]
MGRRRFVRNCGRGLAIAASVGVSAALIHAQDASPATPATACCTQTPVAQPPQPTAHPATPEGPRMAAPEEAAALTANVPNVGNPQTFSLALPTGVAQEGGLQVKTIWAARTIGVLFPEITTIYGYRQDPLKWHPNGLAIDVMIPNPHTDEGIELGNQIAGYALANAQRWGVSHVIWRQKIYPGVGAGSWTADLGNETANHYDHVHIATDGGGYPTGNETYYVGSMNPTAPD